MSSLGIRFALPFKGSNGIEIKNKQTYHQIDLLHRHYLKQKLDLLKFQQPLNLNNNSHDLD